MMPTFIQTTSREDRLLYCAGRASVDDDTLQQVRALLADGDLDWDYVAASASAHGVLGLLNESLHSVGKGLVPAGVISQFEQTNQRHVEHCLFLSGQLTKIAASL